MSKALAEVEARAGASDQDRDAWLAERRAGITATEVRDLFLKGTVFRRELIEKKLGRKTDDFTGNAYTMWGNLREPVIADFARQRYGMVPESRVFHAADEARFLASPDGVGRGFDGEVEIAEYKTSGHDIAPGSPKYDEVGYFIQMTWAMRVMGARRCLYGWEYRLGRPEEGFEAGQLQFAWVDLDVSLADQLEVMAREFLAELDRVAAEPWVAPVVDEVLDTHAVNYLRALELEREAKALKAPAWAALLEAGRSQVSALARVTFSPAVEVEVEEVDYAAAAEAAPDLRARMQEAADAWQEHCQGFVSRKKVLGKPSLRVTALRQKEVSA